QWCRPSHRVDPTVYCVQIVPGQHLPQREVHQRLPAGHQVPYRRVALAQPQVARVQVVRADRDEGTADELLVRLERPQRRLLPGLVTVEGEDDLPGEGV